jgi:hypothetical protein
MGLEAHLNKESDLYFAIRNVAKKSYVHKRGPYAKTLIKRIFQRQARKSNSPYPKDLEALWDANTLVNSVYDNQDRESWKCRCKCTPTPKDTFKYKQRGRPHAHIQGEMLLQVIIENGTSTALPERLTDRQKVDKTHESHREDTK